jgi:hypothetical protein
MKVQTDLKAGDLLTDAAQGADQIQKQVSDYLASAGKQAEGFTSSVTNAATSFWNCLNNSFG